MQPPGTAGHSTDGRWWWDGASWRPAHSSDHRWWWDGAQWVPAVSIDARSWWDGARWSVMPANPPAGPPRRPPHTWVKAAAIVAVVALVCASIVFGLRSLLPKPEPSPSQVAAMPEVNLVMPGSHILAQRSRGPMAMWLGTVSHSTASTDVGVNASKEDVFAFYTRELAARGWTGPSSPTNLNGPEDWTRGSYTCFIVFAGTSGVEPQFPGGAAYTTSYSVNVSYDPKRQWPPRKV